MNQFWVKCPACQTPVCVPILGPEMMQVRDVYAPVPGSRDETPTEIRCEVCDDTFRVADAEPAEDPVF